MSVDLRYVAFGKSSHFVPSFRDDENLHGNKFTVAESLPL